MNNTIPKNIKSLIDEYGSLKEKLGILEKRINEIKAILETLPIGTYYGDEYTANITKRVTVVLDPAKVLSKMRNKDFLDVITVNKTKLLRYLPEKEIDECVTSEKESIVVNVSKK